MLRRWQSLAGCNVTVTSRDVSDQSAALELIDHAQKMAPVGGVFHLAMVCLSWLTETLYANMYTVT